MKHFLRKQFRWYGWRFELIAPILSAIIVYLLLSGCINPFGTIDLDAADPPAEETAPESEAGR